MNSAIVIQEVTEVVPELVYQLDKLVAQLEPKYHFALSVEWLQGVVTCPTNTLLIATDQHGKAVGMLLMISFPAMTGYKTWIEDVVVDEAFRRQGIARKLLEKALGIARSKNITHINLSVRPRRIAANRLYENVGFRLHDTNYYRYIFEEAIP